MVGSDGEDLGWVGVGLEVDDCEGVVEGVEDGVDVDTLLAGRSIDLDITIV